jgi:hypothetical protein
VQCTPFSEDVSTCQCQLSAVVLLKFVAGKILARRSPSTVCWEDAGQSCVSCSSSQLQCWGQAPLQPSSPEINCHSSC